MYCELKKSIYNMVWSHASTQNDVFYMKLIVIVSTMHTYVSRNYHSIGTTIVYKTTYTIILQLRSRSWIQTP